jgi:hypothetical protein
MADTPKLGHFDLLEELAHGGMGTIYRAFDPTLNREVAIKVLRGPCAEDPKFMEEFLREARNAAAISHPHIVQVHFVGEHQGQSYIVMELLRGRTLREIKEKDGPLNEERALDIALQVTEGLQAAYQNQMIHGDIKPANIFVTENVGAKILDFGLAKLADVEVAGSGEIWGSPYYISPERVGQKAEDFRSDIYSLGATLFDALAGHPPFDAEKPEALAIKRLNEKPPLLRSVNPQITEKTEEVVNKMLNKSPLLRYRDYEHLLADLREAKTAATAQRLGVSMRPGPGVIVQEPAGAAVSAKSRLLLIVGAVAGAAVVLAVAWFLMMRKSVPVASPPPVTTTQRGTTTQPPAVTPPVTSGSTTTVVPPSIPTPPNLSASIRQDKAAIEQVLVAVTPLWPVYAFNNAAAQYEAVSGQLTTDEGRKAMQPLLTSVRLLVEFQQLLIADIARQPYTRGDVFTRTGAAVPGRITGATADHFVVAMQYGETVVAWRDLAPAVLVQISESYGVAFSAQDLPPVVARRQLKQAVFCHQYALEDRAAFHATEALRLDPSLRADIIDVFGTVPTYTPPPPPPPPAPVTTPKPKTPPRPKLQSELKK